MIKRQREMLGRLMEVSNKLGNSLDPTATHPHKYIERQRAHAQVYEAVYGILSDEPENPQREWDLENAEEALQTLEALADKDYPDRKGR